MAWLAVDRMIASAEQFRLDGPVDQWKELRSVIHDDVCKNGYDAERGTFVQYYGSKAVDASLLMIPASGFLPPNDPRVIGTIDAVQRELMIQGFVRRYLTDPDVDGLPSGEGVFIPCTLWLATALSAIGRKNEAKQFLERVLALTNDVGLLSEEYDPLARRLLGNFPQALSHVALVTTALRLSGS
jgi:GH15 family glucan-1,4-alpha-glucosidase